MLIALDRGMEWLFLAMEKLAAWPYASILVAPWSLFEWLAYGFLLLGIFRPRPWRWRVLCLAACLFFLGTGEAKRVESLPKGRLSLTMFDVGQGESLLLDLPEGQSLLIDGGGFPGSDFDLGRNVLMPELLARGRRRLDAIALSHPDADHAKGLAYLVDRLPPGEFWIGSGTEAHPGFAALKELARRRGVPLRRLSQGQRWNFGGADFEVLWPPADLEGMSDNNSSLVLRVCQAEYCLLLTGDLEAEAEARLQAMARETQVLKVAHHGSKSSTKPEFLAAWKPKLALISAGEGNRYRLPHRQVLEELERRGIAILRSDRDGQVEVRGPKASPLPSRWSAIRAAVSGSRS
jgi:competence protein ComEC